MRLLDKEFSYRIHSFDYDSIINAITLGFASGEISEDRATLLLENMGDILNSCVARFKMGQKYDLVPRV